MFLSTNIPALFKKGMLKLEKTDDDGFRRVAEATCLIEPFPASLARELGDDIADHLLTSENTIRYELESIDLKVRSGLQNVTVRPDEALDPIALLSPVSVKDVNATVIEDKKMGTRHLAFSFVLVFSLETKAARDFVLDNFGRTLLWTFQALQRDLLATARMHEAAARLSDAGPATLTGPDGESVTFDPESSKRHREVAKHLRGQAKVN